jgi:hypothetical protein
MIPRGVVFADGEWIGIVVFVIFVVFSVLSQLAGKLKDVQREVARRGRANPPDHFPKPADPLEDEIAEFLRRAAERQKPAQPDRPAPRPAPSPPAAEEAMRPFRPPPVPSVPAGEPAAQESVAEHVRDRFGRPQFGQVGSAGLGHEVAQADEKVDERFREKFGRQVSRLASVPGEAAAGAVAVEPAVPADRVAAPPAFDAASVAAMLTNPATLRQVILASEILHRPEERWR